MFASFEMTKLWTFET